MAGLEFEVISALKTQKMTAATAESCTGGLVAKLLTDVPGASSAFMGGVVSYTNYVKNQVLHVPQNLLDTLGAVSAPVAEAMAQGARQITGADMAASVTGVAGPDKDDRGNDVGTVYIGFSTAEGTKAELYHLGNTREEIRNNAAQQIFQIMLDYLNNKKGEQ